MENYHTPRPLEAFILFYFILFYNVREQHYRHCRNVILYPSIFLHTTFFLAMGFSRLYSHVSRGCLVNRPIPRQNATARRSLIVLSFCKLTNIVNFILFYGAAYQKSQSDECIWSPFFHHSADDFLYKNLVAPLRSSSSSSSSVAAAAAAIVAIWAEQRQYRWWEVASNGIQALPITRLL